MIDGSYHSYEENIALTKKVIEYAQAHDVTVEEELIVLAGVEYDVVAATFSTNPFGHILFILSHRYKLKN